MHPLKFWQAFSWRFNFHQSAQIFFKIFFPNLTFLCFVTQFYFFGKFHVDKSQHSAWIYWFDGKLKKSCYKLSCYIKCHVISLSSLSSYSGSIREHQKVIWHDENIVLYFDLNYGNKIQNYNYIPLLVSKNVYKRVLWLLEIWWAVKNSKNLF